MRIDDRTVLTNRMPQEWCCRFDDAGDPYERTAVIYQPINGSHSMVVSIAEIDCIACDQDEDGDPTLVRHGEEAERLRNVVLLTHAPNMLDAIRRAHARLDALVEAGCKGDGWANCPVTHKVWVAMEEIRRELERVAEHATDIDNF